MRSVEAGIAGVSAVLAVVPGFLSFLFCEYLAHTAWL